MAADGSHGPKPWTQRRASTLFLRVPTVDWAAVRHGYKREFRAGSGIVSQLHDIPCPVPVVAYRIDSRGQHEGQLMILERVWREQLGAISNESLIAEGFSTRQEFREYWMGREHRRFRPTRQVTCYQVRLWREEDLAECGNTMIRRLYGEFLGEQ